MDESRLDNFFKDELESYPEVPLKEGAWQRLNAKLPEGPKRSYWPWLLGFLTFLLIGSLFISYLLFKSNQQHKNQIEALAESIHSLSSDHISSQKDTIYIYQKDTLYIQPKASDIDRMIVSWLTQNDSKSTKEEQLAEAKDLEDQQQEITEGYPKEVEQIDEETGTTSTSEEDIRSNPIPTLSKDTAIKASQTPKPATGDNDDEQKKENKLLNAVKNYLSNRSFAYGLRAEAGVYQGAASTPGSLWGGSVGTQLQLGRRFDIFTNVGYNYTFYHTESPLEDFDETLLGRYPNLDLSDPSRSLHEIYARGHQFNLATGLRYKLIKTKGFALAFAPSIQFQSLFSQQFEYEFSVGNDEVKIPGSTNGGAFELATGRLELQTEWFLNKRMGPRLGLFLERDLKPYGIEQWYRTQFGFSANWIWYTKGYDQ